VVGLGIVVVGIRATGIKVIAEELVRTNVASFKPRMKAIGAFAVAFIGEGASSPLGQDPVEAGALDTDIECSPLSPLQEVSW
jgi:hypothetical protein